MSEIEFRSEIGQIQKSLQKDKNLLSITLTRIFDAEARIQKLKAYLKDKQSAKISDWNHPQFAAARLSFSSAAGQPHHLPG